MPAQGQRHLWPYGQARSHACIIFATSKDEQLPSTLTVPTGKTCPAVCAARPAQDPRPADPSSRSANSFHTNTSGHVRCSRGTRSRSPQLTVLQTRAHARIQAPRSCPSLCVSLLCIRHQLHRVHLVHVCDDQVGPRRQQLSCRVSVSLCISWLCIRHQLHRVHLVQVRDHQVGPRRQQLGGQRVGDGNRERPSCTGGLSSGLDWG